MILVAGGTGRLGAELVPRLRSAGLPVRVLTRDAARAGYLRQLGAEIVVGDVRDPATLEAATSGVTTVVSAIHGFAVSDGGTPARVDRDGNAALVDAAAAAGARVVLLSVLGAAQDHPLVLFRMKAAAEHHLRTHAHRWTIVRSAPFGELQLELLCAALAAPARRSSSGEARKPGERRLGQGRRGRCRVGRERRVRRPGARRRPGPEDLTSTRLAPGPPGIHLGAPTCPFGTFPGAC